MNRKKHFHFLRAISSLYKFMNKKRHTCEVDNLVWRMRDRVNRRRKIKMYLQCVNMYGLAWTAISDFKSNQINNLVWYPQQFIELHAFYCGKRMSNPRRETSWFIMHDKWERTLRRATIIMNRTKGKNLWTRTHARNKWERQQNGEKNQKYRQKCQEFNSMKFSILPSDIFINIYRSFFQSKFGASDLFRKENKPTFILTERSNLSV